MEAAHRSVDHGRAQGGPSRHRSPGALPLTRHLEGHVLELADTIRWA